MPRIATLRPLTADELSQLHIALEGCIEEFERARAATGGVRRPRAPYRAVRRPL
jgi:hypothetical protein